MTSRLLLLIAIHGFASGVTSLRAAERETKFTPATKDERGQLVHQVESAYQSGQTEIRVLLPQPYDATVRYPVVYVLPVEAGRETRYGDGLWEIQKRKLHEQHAAIFVAPTFSHLPWYADHPSKAEIRQEAYLLQVVIPFIDKTYPTEAKREGRYLLGFSKSGWGAWSLLLRHPDVFRRAAAWDAPLLLDRPGKYGSGDVFATAENFAGYQITSLLKAQADALRKEPEQRLILTGYGNFRQDHQQVHKLMEELMIPHVYEDGPALAHDWHSGWVEPALERLLAE